ncbi:MAG: helix-turn-helix domain-containing protein [Arenimonas sp.]|nr:helix-turn-helix domain-containing protein [Arenimonas sp.]MBP7981683.1 helix-turn-helix domain-containing protein [Arenimonas sp.]
MSSPQGGAASSDRALARIRIDARLAVLRANRSAAAVPHGGWIRAIRQSLGMSLDGLAERLAVSRSSAARLESSEQRETLQLDTLRRAAEALGCELAYVLIPKRPLQEMVELQRAAMVQQLNAKVHTHMALEGQDTPDSSLDEWRRQHGSELVSDRQLWKKPK